MNRLEKAREFRRKINANLQATRKLIRVDELSEGVHDAYNTGDKVIYEGKVYESIIDGNTWNPLDYPQGWKLI